MRARRLFLLSLVAMVSVGSAQAALSGLPPYTPDGNAERGSIPAVYRFDLGALYASDEAWAAALADAKQGLTELAAYHGRLHDPEALATYLDRYFSLELAIHRLTLYANLEQVTDTSDQGAMARHQTALNLTDAIMNEGTVMRQAILALTPAEVETAYQQVPALKRFEPAIAELRRRADRVLDPEAERVLALAGDNLWAAIDLNELPSDNERAFQSLISEMPLPSITDAQGNQVQLTFGNYPLYRAAADRRVRREAVAGVFGSLKRFESTFAAALAGQARRDVFMARARHYDTALDAYLDKDDIDPQVYLNLIATVRAHADALHRYVALRKRVMGLDDLHIYDLYVPMVEGVDKDLPYPAGAELILQALAPLGPEYLETAGRLIDPHNGAIDVYPAAHKESGAFSSSVYGVHPYIKLNYMDRYDDVSTLAHELGHAVHSELADSHQPYLTSRYVPFLAEVASTCNEMLLSRYMTAHVDSKAERAWLLSELAETIRTTIYRQTMFAEFDLAVHKLAEAGEPITAERLDGIYGDLVRAYYGPGFTVDADDSVEWAYIPHFYYKYYVYSYATGLASGIAIAQRVADGVPGAREGYLGMLEGGSSKPPLELLKGAGVDLTKPDAIAAALDLFDRTVTELGKLLQKD